MKTKLIFRFLKHSFCFPVKLKPPRTSLVNASRNKSVITSSEPGAIDRWKYLIWRELYYYGQNYVKIIISKLLKKTMCKMKQKWIVTNDFMHISFLFNFLSNSKTSSVVLWGNAYKSQSFFFIKMSNFFFMSSNSERSTRLSCKERAFTRKLISRSSIGSSKYEIYHCSYLTHYDQHSNWLAQHDLC